jgi:hypothetical protein
MEFGIKIHFKTDAEAYVRIVGLSPARDSKTWKKSRAVVEMEARHLMQSLKHLDL